jgi:epoxyqueuosine reductase
MTPFSPAALRARLLALARDEGFDLAGVAPVEPSAHGAFLREWLGEGRHGEMGYLARPDALERREDPGLSLPGARAALVVAHNYHQPDPEGVPEDAGRGVIARYARGRDYHKVVRKKLERVHRRLDEALGEAVPARAYTDTGPLLERELAVRAGLGWFGRNTMLIHPRKGSYLFLGVLLLGVEVEADEPFRADHCGSCRACLDACPTGALLGRTEDGAPVMDARLCISYLTIEHRGPIPRELRPAIGNRVYGCDICQEVCPFNTKFSSPASEPSYAARGPGERPVGVEALSAESEAPPGLPLHPGTEAPSLVELLRLALSDEGWEAFSRGSAIRRAGRAGMARNVSVALGNWGSEEAVPVLSDALSDPAPVVRGHAAWALGRVGGAAARSALEAALSSEQDPWVREELDLALDR